MAKELTPEEKGRINALKAKADALARGIEYLNKIAGDDQEMKAQFSPLIMQMLRAEHVYIPIVNVESYRESDTVTLDPKDLYTEIPEDSRKLFQPIFANSFGPWNADNYFKMDGDHSKYRILWILKEPFNENWNDGDRGGHNQAEEFNDLNKLYPTHKKLVNLNRVFFENCGVFLTMQETMLRTGVLEFDYFPGLSFNNPKTNDQVIYKWAEINARLNKALIKFYDPTIVFGIRDYMGYLCNFKDEDGNIKVEPDIFNVLRGGYEALEEHKYFNVSISDEPTKGGFSLKEKEKIDASILYTENRIYVGYNHPLGMTEDEMTIIFDSIKNQIKKRK